MNEYRSVEEIDARLAEIESNRTRCRPSGASALRRRHAVPLGRAEGREGRARARQGRVRGAEGVPRVAGEAGAKLERGAGSPVARANRNAAPENVFDLSEYHTRSTSQEHMSRLLEDGAKRAVDGFRYPNDASTRRTRRGSSSGSWRRTAPTRRSRSGSSSTAPRLPVGVLEDASGQPLNAEEQRKMHEGMEIEAARADDDATVASPSRSRSTRPSSSPRRRDQPVPAGVETSRPRRTSGRASRRPASRRSTGPRRRDDRQQPDARRTGDQPGARRRVRPVHVGGRAGLGRPRGRHGACSPTRRTCSRRRSSRSVQATRRTSRRASSSAQAPSSARRPPPRSAPSTSTRSRRPSRSGSSRTRCGSPPRPCSPGSVAGGVGATRAASGPTASRSASRPACSATRPTRRARSARPATSPSRSRRRSGASSGTSRSSRSSTGSASRSSTIDTCSTATPPAASRTRTG
jgi:hypothetical protein